MQIIKTIWTAIILSLLISCVPGTNEIPIGTNALSEIRETAADMLTETPAENFYLSDNGDCTLAVIGYKGEGTTVVLDFCLHYTAFSGKMQERTGQSPVL